MRFTLIKSDSNIGIDGEFYKVVMPSWLHESIRVVQYDTVKESGHVEHTDFSNTELTKAEYEEKYSALVQIWSEGKLAHEAEFQARVEKIRADEAAAFAANEQQQRNYEASIVAQDINGTV